MKTKTKTKLPTDRAAAIRFVQILRQWLTDDELKQVILRNRAETLPDVCHSHDFCDANMALHDALIDLDVEVFDEEAGTMHDDALDLMNRAHALAKKDYLS